MVRVQTALRVAHLHFATTSTPGQHYGGVLISPPRNLVGLQWTLVDCSPSHKNLFTS